MTTYSDAFGGTGDLSGHVSDNGLGTWAADTNALAPTAPTVGDGVALFLSGAITPAQQSGIAGASLVDCLGAIEVYADITPTNVGSSTPVPSAGLLLNAAATPPIAGVGDDSSIYLRIYRAHSGTWGFNGLSLGQTADDLVTYFWGNAAWPTQEQNEARRVGVVRDSAGHVRVYYEPAGGGERTYIDFLNGTDAEGSWNHNPPYSNDPVKSYVAFGLGACSGTHFGMFQNGYVEVGAQVGATFDNFTVSSLPPTVHIGPLTQTPYFTLSSPLACQGARPITSAFSTNLVGLCAVEAWVLESDGTIRSGVAGDITFTVDGVPVTVWDYSVNPYTCPTFVQTFRVDDALKAEEYLSANAGILSGSALVVASYEGIDSTPIRLDILAATLAYGKPSGWWVPLGPPVPFVVGTPWGSGNPLPASWSLVPLPQWREGDGEFSLGSGGVPVTGTFTGTRYGPIQFAGRLGSFTGIVPVTIGTDTFYPTFVNGIMVLGIPCFEVGGNTAWRTAGEVDELGRRLVGLGATFSPGASQLVSYDGERGALSVTAETQETTWTAPSGETTDWRLR